MSIDLTNTNIKNNVRPWVNNTLRQDLFTLRDKLAQRTVNPIEEISKECKIPSSILNEIEKGHQLVSDSTIYRFYKYFLSVVESEILGIRHEWIRLKFLSEKLKNDGELNHDIELALESSPTLRKLYLKSRLHPLNVQNVQQLYGDEGRISLDVLESFKLVSFDKTKNAFVATDKYFSKCPKLLKKLIEHLVQDGINEQELWSLGSNTCFYGLEWVSKEGHEKIIHIMDNAKKDIKHCLENDKNKKEVPLLVIGAVDKFKSCTSEELK